MFMKLTNRSDYFKVDNKFDVLGIVKGAINHWWLFAFSIPFAAGLSWWLVRDAEHKYNVNSALHTTREFEFPTHGAENRITGLQIHSGINNIYNYIGRINTHSVLYESLYELGYEVDYMRGGKVRFGELPFTVELDKARFQAIKTPVKIKAVSEDQFRVTCNSESHQLFDYQLNTLATTSQNALRIDTVLNYGEWFDAGDLKFQIHRNAAVEFQESQSWTFVNRDVGEDAFRYWQRIRVKTLNKGASIITMAITTSEKEKDLALIDKMMEVFTRNDLETKNGVSRTTIDFLDGQLNLATHSVAQLEAELIEVKTKAGILDVTTSGNRLLKEFQSHDREKAELNTQLEYFRFLLQQCTDDVRMDTLLAPSLQGINDVALTRLVQEHTAMQFDREELLFFAGPRNPRLLSLNAQLDVSRKTILETISGLITSAEIKLGQLDREIQRNNYRLALLPTAEREIVKLQRDINAFNRQIKYMNKKRSQAELALVSNLPDCSILEFAHVKGNRIVAPIDSLSYAMIIFIGFLFPFVVIMIRTLSGKKITSPETLRKLSNGNYIGSLPYIRMRKKKPIEYNEELTQLNENWRQVTLNLLDNLEKGSSGLLILNGTTERKMGSSFIFSNLCGSVRSLGKKAVVVDLNSPGHSRRAMAPHAPSIQQFVSGECDYNSLIYKQFGAERINLGHGDLELTKLIETHEFKELLLYLKSDYDLVFIDAPTRDNEHFRRFAKQHGDHLLFVFRDGVSAEKSIDEANALIQAWDLPASNLLNAYREMRIRSPWKKNGHYARSRQGLTFNMSSLAGPIRAIGKSTRGVFRKRGYRGEIAR